jgi:hypothetical protein
MSAVVGVAGIDPGGGYDAEGVAWAQAAKMLKISNKAKIIFGFIGHHFPFTILTTISDNSFRI